MIFSIGAYSNDGNGDVDGTGSSWKQLDQDINGEAADDWSGKSVSLSADGKTVATGAHVNDEKGDQSGHVRVYHIEDDCTGWKQLGQDIVVEKSSMIL